MSSSDLRAIFVDHVFNQVTADTYLQALLGWYLSVIPAPFWSAPASSSGKYHPPFALGEGGLVRHSVAVMYVADDYAKLWNITDPQERAVLLLAAALHDTFKGGTDETWRTTLQDHPDIAAAHVRHFIYPGASSFMDNYHVAMIAHAIQGHQSLWGMERQPLGQQLGMPEAIRSALVMADYTVSRRNYTPDDALSKLLLRFGWEEN